MFTKVYWGFWTTLALITAALLATGNLGWLGITVIGFASCTLIFMGMICVTPTVVGPHADEFQHGDAEPVVKKERVRIREGFAHAAASVQNRHA
jgi:hypothetical protein